MRYNYSLGFCFSWCCTRYIHNTVEIPWLGIYIYKLKGIPSSETLLVCYSVIGCCTMQGTAQHCLHPSASACVGLRHALCCVARRRNQTHLILQNPACVALHIRIWRKGWRKPVSTAFHVVSEFPAAADTTPGIRRKPSQGSVETGH